jgi:tetratricopeptide (TPR) repeat protein
MHIDLLFRWSLLLALAVNLIAQPGHPTAPGLPTSPTAPTNPGPGNTNSPFPGSSRSTYPDQSALPLYLSGKVVMEDGTPPPEPVVIHLLCKANPRPVAYTDSKGYFSANVTDKIGNAVMADASDPYGASHTALPSGGTSGSSGLGARDLLGCVLEASLAGFRSTSIDLGVHQALDNPDVGTLFLHRLANVEGLTISATSALAPKDAKKALEKARNDELKAKWPEAEKELQKAVTIYPKYAAAWLELGNVQQKEGQRDAARKSYGQASAADPKFVSPLMQLALMDGSDQKWADVADETDRLLRLNPVDFPQAWTYNALANYNLKRMELAEKSAREGLSRDSAHHFPTNSHVLGLVLAQKHDYPGSVQNLRDYLHYAPDAPDSAEVKKELAEMEKAIAPEPSKP